MTLETPLPIKPLDPSSGVTIENLAARLRAGESPSDVVRAFMEAPRAACPDDPRSLLYHGWEMQLLGKPQDAEAAYRRALGTGADGPPAMAALGALLRKTGAPDHLIDTMYEIGVRCRPDSGRLLACHGVALLSSGDFQRGWKALNDGSRRQWGEVACVEALQQLAPLWDGTQDVAGKTVALCHEWGYGDGFQFVRYADALARRGATVVVVCRGTLAPLFRTASGVSSVYDTENDSAPPFRPDFYLPMLFAPVALGTDLWTVPSYVPYLRADHSRVVAWRDRIRQDGSVKVGLVWQGSPGHMDDHMRSCRLGDLAPLLDVEGATFYALQRGHAAAQVVGTSVVSLAEELRDYGETAAAVVNLDLVVSVDTSVAHLAGALGRPTWTLLSNPAEFRWLRSREDTPWYPTMRLIRQDRLGNWAGVATRAAEMLREMVEHRRTTESLDRHGFAAPPAARPA